MDKLSCIEDYFVGTRSYYLFKMGQFYDKSEYMEFILDKRNLNGAKVAFLSNIMLGIKEDLVDTKGPMDYQSKVFINSLENSVSFVAMKVENGYKIGNYVFPDAATLVAIVRNKLAHGRYKIDFDHNRVILEHKGVEIIINIDKLINFILMAFRNTMRETKSEKYERNIVYFTRSDVARTRKITDLVEVKKILKNYNYLNFTIESTNMLPVPYDCMSLFEVFLDRFERDGYLSLKGQQYKELVKYLDKRGCKISYECKKITDDNEIERILRFADSEIVGNDNLDYFHQLEVIGYEVQKSINKKSNTFNAIVANVNNLIELSAIGKINSVRREDISLYIERNYPDEIKSSYDEFGMILISMFNSLFIYPYDDVYDVNGGYSPIRSDNLDFASLDLSMVNSSIITIDESPLMNSKMRLDGLSNKQVELSEKLKKQQNNLNRVSGNMVAITNIQNSINDLNNALAKLMTDYMIVDAEYRIIKNDYMVNGLYFRNKAIIEGIRNAIAHGNYEFITNGNFWDTIIVFNDIYEGKVTFQLKITFREFEEMINKNYDIVLEYVRNKNKENGRKL